MLVVTLGTGIGSALIVDGHLVPNTELGHLEIDGYDAETRAADSARDREDLTGSSGPSACSATSPSSRTCSGPTCSSSAAA